MIRPLLLPLLLASYAGAAAKQRPCVAARSDGGFDEPATFKALKDCQARERQALLDQVYAKTRSLPDDAALEELEDRQREETRSYLRRHEAADDSEAETAEALAAAAAARQKAGRSPAGPAKAEEADDAPLARGGKAYLAGLRDDAAIAMPSARATTKSRKAELDALPPQESVPGVHAFGPDLTQRSGPSGAPLTALPDGGALPAAAAAPGHGLEGAPNLGALPTVVGAPGAVIPENPLGR